MEPNNINKQTWRLRDELNAKARKAKHGLDDAPATVDFVATASKLSTETTVFTITETTKIQNELIADGIELLGNHLRRIILITWLTTMAGIIVITLAIGNLAGKVG